jgi:photosystem II stability/assembly factor-like uncharacterized protein
LKHEILTKNNTMMKRLLLIFVGLMAFGLLSAQTGWIEKNSNTAATKGVGNISVGLLDQTALWGLVINTDGSIFDGFTKSMDGGQNWFPGTFNAGSGLSQLFAINASTCWALFNTGATQGCYKTTNGGTTWTKQGTAFGSSSFADAMHFFNATDGWAMGDPVGGYFEIYTTNDGGSTWVRVPSANIPAPVSGEYGITGNYSAVDNNIWFGTNKGRVFHSADKGLHWTVALSNFGATETVQAEFASETYGICFRSYLNIGLETAIGVTTDGGATWTTVNVSGPMYARYFAYVPGTEKTFVGSSGGVAGANGISYSTDGGYTWAAITEGYDFLGTVWLDNATGWSGSYARAARTVGGIYIYDGDPLEPFAVPTISLSADQIEATAEQNTSVAQDLTVSNVGEATLDYQVNILYSAPGKKVNPVSIPVASNREMPDNHVASLDPDPRPSGYNPPPTDDAMLSYDDGTYYSAIGWNNAPVSPQVAAMFPASLVSQYTGMYLTSVDIYINDPGTNYILKVWDMGSATNPGVELVSQVFSAQSLSWNNVELADPVFISGADIWIGYQFTQPDSALFIPGCDAGPANPLGDFVTTGVSWGHLSDNAELNYNWLIHGNLTGTPVEQWLTVAPTSGSIDPAGSNLLTVTSDAAGLDVGTYYATIRFVSNDPATPVADVPVTFNVIPGGAIQSVVLDFEAQDDFAITFDPWTALDVDLGATYGFETITFPGMYDPTAFIAFNPAATTPAMSDDPEIQPHSGLRFGACFNTVPPPFNDDWIISPQTTLGTNSSITLWAKSYTDEYGQEMFNVLVSTTDMDPASFTSISGDTPVEAPMAWTEFSYDLSAYDGQTVYVAIQCVSEDRFIFMLDDVSIDFILSTPEPSKEVNLSVYPNPAHDNINITAGVDMNQVEIFNQLGQRVYSQILKNTNLNLSTSEFQAGVYFVRVTTTKGVATEKVMIR